VITEIEVVGFVEGVWEYSKESKMEGGKKRLPKEEGKYKRRDKQNKIHNKRSMQLLY